MACLYLDCSATACAIAAGGRKCIFEPALLVAPLALRVLPFDRWSTRVPLRDGAPASSCESFVDCRHLRVNHAVLCCARSMSRQVPLWRGGAASCRRASAPSSRCC